MIYKKSVLLALLGIFSFLYSTGQGCSDAGFCTINTFKPNSEDSIPSLKNHLKTGINYGAADHNISVLGAYIEYKRQLNNFLTTDLKLTSASHKGNNITTFNLSDIFFNLNYIPVEKLRFTIGLKVPLSDGNDKKNDLPLPMDYQSSLGTFDLIAGIGYKINRLDLVAAIQQPLTQNKNEFFADIYAHDDLFSSFQSTNNYKRSSDVLIRISYPFSFGDNFKIIAGLLPIYHLNNDKYTDLTGTEREIKGSHGLTLNGNIYFNYFINRNNSLQLSFGAPLIVRDQRPDGLTRSYVVNLEYIFGF
ncbi:MAG: hypothetical protein ACR2GN_02880 [Bacteroidia bacterium]